jgi:uncharacterized protein RhaS with RHS repeats
MQGQWPVRIRYRFENGIVPHSGHFAQFTSAVSDLAETKPWAIPYLGIGTTAQVRGGVLDLAGLSSTPSARLRVIEAAGEVLVELTYDAEGRPEHVDYSDGIRVGYRWNEGGWLTSAMFAPDEAITWTYREDGLVTSVTYPSCRRFLYEYTDDGRPLLRIYPDGQSISFKYEPGGHLVETRSSQSVFTYPADQDSNRILWQHNIGVDSYSCLNMQDSAEVTFSSSPNSAHGRQRVSSALGTWTYEEGHLRDMILPTGERLSLHLDRLEARSWSIYGQTIQRYDASGKCTSIVQDNGNRLFVHPVKDGHRFLLVSPYHTSLHELDDRGRLCRIRSAEGKYTVLQHDHQNRLLRTADAEGWICLKYYGRDGGLCRLRSSVGTNTRFFYESPPIPNRLVIATGRQKLGLAALTMARQLWHLSAMDQLMLASRRSQI